MFLLPFALYQVLTYGAHIKCLERCFHPRVLISDASIMWKWFNGSFPSFRFCGMNIKCKALCSVASCDTRCLAPLLPKPKGINNSFNLEKLPGSKNCDCCKIHTNHSTEHTVSRTSLLFLFYFLFYRKSQLFCGKALASPVEVCPELLKFTLDCKNWDNWDKPQPRTPGHQHAG